MYWFLDAADNVLYVGKAKNLKNRLTNYKQWQQTRGKTRKLVLAAQTLKFEVLESELEALLTEAELIRTHQPPYNILLKDDKTPLYVVITKETFPRVLTVRRRDLEKHQIPKGKLFGPYQSAFQVKEVLSTVRHIFPWCNAGPASKRPCFFAHVELCPGVCTHSISAAAYQESIDALALFLRGKSRPVIALLKERMKLAAEHEQFEDAAVLKYRIEAILNVTKKQFHLRPDVQLPKLHDSNIREGLTLLRHTIAEHAGIPKSFPLQRIECYDVSNIQGTNASVSMVVATDGEIDTDAYRQFRIRLLDTPNDFAMLQEALTRRQNHPEWGEPSLVVIDGGKGQVRAVKKVWSWSCPIIGIAKNPDRLIIPTPHAGTDVVTLPPDHPGLLIIQRLRDEAHRFAKKYHSTLRTRTMLDSG